MQLWHNDENNLLVESLAACHGSHSELTKYFMVNKAFVNYPDQFDNLTDPLADPPVLIH